MITQQRGLQVDRAAITGWKRSLALLIVQEASQINGQTTSVTLQPLHSGLGEGPIQGIISLAVLAKPGHVVQSAQTTVIIVSWNSDRGQLTTQVVTSAPGQWSLPNLIFHLKSVRPTASCLPSSSCIPYSQQIRAAMTGHEQNVLKAARIPVGSNITVLTSGATVIQRGVGGMSKIRVLLLTGQAQYHHSHTNHTQIVSRQPSQVCLRVILISYFHPKRSGVDFLSVLPGLSSLLHFSQSDIPFTRPLFGSPRVTCRQDNGHGLFLLRRVEYITDTLGQVRSYYREPYLNDGQMDFGYVKCQ